MEHQQGVSSPGEEGGLPGVAPMSQGAFGVRI